jgi:phosphoribosylformylglycinamidine cyclo-ligase
LVSGAASLDEPAYAGAARTLGEELLVPSVLYTPCVLALRRELGAGVHAVAHVTGGGIVGNVARLLSGPVDAVIDMESFPTPEIFYEVQRRGPVGAEEMVRVFNCGLGMVLALDASAGEAAVTLARASGLGASVVGQVRSGAGEVVFT